jgi:solute carrier family 13 (sodium-dependent dicarboxylate transporter), member 2/3/5
MNSNRSIWFLVLAFSIATSCWLLNPFELPLAALKVLTVAVFMIVLWVSEALPMPAVALLPVVLFPLLGISTTEEAVTPYADKIIFLFMGGFLIALAMEKWTLHKRIALYIVNKTGTSGNRIVLGFILATGCLSMWLSNTATTMMMYPIAMSVVAVMEKHQQNSRQQNHFAVCLLLSIAYASNFGGIATIIGTPPNVAYVGFLAKKYQYTFQFAEWMLLCMPIALLLMLSLYWVITRFLFPIVQQTNANAQLAIQQQLTNLGPITKSECRVLVVFLLTASLWIFKDIVNAAQPWFKLDDTLIAMGGGLLLFVIPSGSSTTAGALLQWSDTTKMAWGILLLFGGGISLAAQLEKAGLIQQVGVFMAKQAGNNTLLLIVSITVLSIFISEVMSNVAQVIVFAPVMSGMADALGTNPLLLGIPMTLAASCASMLPMGTPPNAIVFASGRLRLKQMMLAGFVMNIIAILLITVFSYWLLPLIVKTLPQ